MDKIDLQIIEELRDNARKPFRRIAKKIGVSTQTAIKRYNRMKKGGIIQLSSISINLEKIGYQGTAHLLITHSPASSISEVMSHIKKMPNIVIASKAIGDFEGYAVLLFKDIKELYAKILEIKKLPSISKLEVSVSVPGFGVFPPPEVVCTPISRKED